MKKRTRKSDPKDRRIKVFVDVGLCNCERKDYLPLPDSWDALSKEAQDELLDEIAREFRNETIDYGAYLVAKEGD